MLNSDRLAQILAIQDDLRRALDSILSDLQGKIKPNELRLIEEEYQTLIELFESLKDGKVRIAIFGKASSGKSSVANAIFGEPIFETGIGIGLTTIAQSKEFENWKIIDLPGIMNSTRDDEIAMEEVKRSHGRIFVLDAEPFEPEIKMFDEVANFFDAPTIVFFNKYDVLEQMMLPKDRDTVKSRVIDKMTKYVRNPEDIVFGSAALVDRNLNEMVINPVPKLIERLYESAGDLGLIINVIDPAHQATEKINLRIYKVREEIARRVISGYATGAAWGSLIPASSMITTPLFIHNMNRAICNIMGVSEEDTLEARKVSDAFWSAVTESIGIELGWSAAAIVAGIFTGGLGTLVMTGIGTWREWDNNVLRVLAVGEALLEYIRSDFKLTELDVKELLENIKRRIQEEGLYKNLSK